LCHISARAEPGQNTVCSIAGFNLRPTQQESGMAKGGKTAQSTKASHQTDKASGQKGVSQEQVGSGKKSDPNNFANDRERAAAAGRKGGQKSH